ncbi:MAG: DUF1330 domain-containing protein [Myxococcota bacterium]|nr:DUF1330 domain-containing protein [Myxococcota bacterium]
MDAWIDDEELAELLLRYEPDGEMAALERWRRLFASDSNGPVVLVNHFVLRERAVYPDGREATGQQAFSDYTAVSMQALTRVGGRFLAAGPPLAGLFGSSADEDMVVVGWYPDRGALLDLLRDPAYQQAFAHRRAALEVDRVVALDALPL